MTSRGQCGGSALTFSFVFQNRINSVHQNLGSKELYPSLGAPPPLISPKAPHHLTAPPTTLWNPASLIDNSADSRRRPDPPTPPSRPPPGLTRAERPNFTWGEKLEDGARRRAEGLERYTTLRGQEAGSWTKTEQDRATQNLHQHHHVNNLHQKPGAPADHRGKCRTASPSAPREQLTTSSVLIYDEVLQQQRRLLSKLDMEEKKRKEAKEEGERPSLKKRLSKCTDYLFIFFFLLLENVIFPLFSSRQVIIMTWMSHMMKAMRRR